MWPRRISRQPMKSSTALVAFNTALTVGRSRTVIGSPSLGRDRGQVAPQARQRVRFRAVVVPAHAARAVHQHEVRAVDEGAVPAGLVLERDLLHAELEALDGEA